MQRTTISHAASGQLNTATRSILHLNSKSRSVLARTFGQTRHKTTRTPQPALMAIPLKPGLQTLRTEMPSTTFPTRSLTKALTMPHTSTPPRKSSGTKPGSIKSASQEMLRGSALTVSSLLLLQGYTMAMFSEHGKRTVSLM